MGQTVQKLQTIHASASLVLCKSEPDLLLSFLQALAFTIGPALGPAQSFKDGHERCGQKFGYGVYWPRIFKEIDVFSSILAQYRLPIYHFNENFRASTTVLSDL